MILCCNVLTVWPKTALRLPVWPRDTESLDTPALETSVPPKAPFALPHWVGVHGSVFSQHPGFTLSWRDCGCKLYPSACLGVPCLRKTGVSERAG